MRRRGILRHARPRDLGALLAAMLSFAGACGGDGDRPATPDSLAGADSAREPDAAEALRFMAAADQAEMQAAQLAVRKTTDRAVLQFAQLMYREHSRSAREVGDLARQMDVNLQAAGGAGTLVTNVQTLSQQTSQLLNNTPRGPGFDRTYIDTQIRMHQAVLQGLQRIARGGGRGVGADIAPGAGVDVGLTVTPAAGATTAPAPARGGAASRPRSRSTGRSAATPQEAARMAVPRVQEHLEQARQIQSRLAGGAG